jgi:hypothetical protein
LPLFLFEEAFLRWFKAIMCQAADTIVLWMDSGAANWRL